MVKRLTTRVTSLLALLPLALAGSLSPGAAQDRSPDPAVFNALEWRLIGPFRGGKSLAVLGHPTQTAVFVMGVTNGGGLWRTDDAGITWHNISDGYFNTTTISAVAMSRSDPDVIYAGTGDISLRTNISRGDGVYRSDDGGRTWRHIGLRETRNISRIEIHPDDPDHVYVAALGHGFSPSEERGVFRSTDGGETWERVLFIGDEYGVIDLALDWSRPEVLYASSWNGRRYPWTIRDAGPDNGIWKTTDGGDTWENITANPGLPAGVKGKITLDISQSSPDRIWAIMTAEGDGTSGLYRADAPGQEGWEPCRDYYCSGNGLYRSEDGGETWERVKDDPNFFQRPWYYTHVVADPTDPDVVYTMNTSLWKSSDGGESFRRIGLPHGDAHALWIDPLNPSRMINGNDGGATVTLNGGRTWSSVENQPTSMLYNASVDDDFPFNACAPQQDNSSICVPSRSDHGFIWSAEWKVTGGGENGGIAVDPNNPEISYGGDHHWVSRLDHTTGQRRWISPWPENYYGHGEDVLRYRWVWDFKVILSPHDPNVLYTASQVVHRSTDQGQSWEDISPDLSAPERSKFETTPPSDRAPYWSLTRENVGIEWYSAITSLAESSVRQGVLWTGSNDGVVHVTADGGQSWSEVTPEGIVADTWISTVEPSSHDPAAAYVVANRHMMGEDHPLVFKTTDYGETWTPIHDGFPEDDFVWVVREDPERRGLLYAAAEWSGVYVSFDDGMTWQSIRLDLPVTPVRDLKLKEGDLVAATHGRSFWILDDVTPLRALHEDPGSAEPRLFAPRPTVRFRENIRSATRPAQYTPTTVGSNPPSGVLIRYSLPSSDVGEVVLSIHDAAGEEIRTFSSRGSLPRPGPDLVDPSELVEPGVSVNAGGNTFVWDMRYPEAVDWVPRSLIRHRDPLGPLAPPGRYEVRLTVDGATRSQPFDIVPDPRVLSTQADFDEQFALLVAMRDRISTTHRTVDRIHRIRGRIENAIERAGTTSSLGRRIREAGVALDRELWTIEDQLRQFRASEEHRAKQELINWPVRINDKFAKLMEHLETADARPTQRDLMLFEDLSMRLSEQIRRLEELIAEDVAAFEDLIRPIM
jgi:photosystem II stability/assembly factor-like uncharacterized protein